MTRPILLTAALGFVACIACFVIAFALGGFSWKHWLIEFDTDHKAARHFIDGGGPTVTRALTWTGGKQLILAAPVDVVFTQGPDAKVDVTGPKGSAEAIQLIDGSISLRGGISNLGGVRVAVTAPDVREFVLAGSGELRLEGLDQDKASVTIAGSGDVEGRGKVRDLEVNIVGSGDANLGKLMAQVAQVNIAGSGDAVVAARDRVEATVAGSGDIRLENEPRELQSHVMGSGDIVHLNHPSPAVAPSAPLAPKLPVPPKPPAPKPV